MCLPIFTKMIATLTVNEKNMYQAASGGFTNATDAADYLVKKGLAFRDAHEVIGKLVLYCVNHQTSLEALPLDIYKSIHPIFDEDVYEAIALSTCVNGRKVKGGPSHEALCFHFEKATNYLASLEI